MKRVVCAVVLLAATGAAAQDWEGDLARNQGTLHTMLGVTWDSQYVWRGFDLFDDDGAMHVLADLNLFETGFGASVVGHQSLGESLGDLQRWDGTLYYQNGVFAGEPLATNFRLGYVYYYYARANEGLTRDLMEAHLILSWPNLLPIKGLQPSYVAAYVWPGRESDWTDQANPEFEDNATGLFQMLMLDYAFAVPGLAPSMDDQVIRIHSELVYNGGVSPYGANISAGFTHAVLGASTDIPLDPDGNLTLTPAVYYQFSFEDTVNPDNELWASIGLKLTF